MTHFWLAFSRFVHVRGWPAVVYSDPGSQLVGAEREMHLNEKTKDNIIKRSAEAGTRWVFGPGDSPWHQGAVEALVKTAKRCIHFAVHTQRLTPAEYLSLAYEIANLINERPIGYRPSPDSEIKLLTPNNLLLGRSNAQNPGNLLPVTDHATRFRLVRETADQFWKRWTELYAPTLIKQNKWLQPKRDLKEGDVVLVAEKSLKGTYKLARVIQTIPGADGRVRKVRLCYKNFKPGEPLSKYSGTSDTVITRAVQRLALIVEENQMDPIANE